MKSSVDQPQYSQSASLPRIVIVHISEYYEAWPRKQAAASWSPNKDIILHLYNLVAGRLRILAIYKTTVTTLF